MTIFFGIFRGLKPLTFSDLLILEIASSFLDSRSSASGELGRQVFDKLGRQIEIDQRKMYDCYGVNFKFWVSKLSKSSKSSD